MDCDDVAAANDGADVNSFQISGDNNNSHSDHNSSVELEMKCIDSYADNATESTDIESSTSRSCSSSTESSNINNSGSKASKNSGSTNSRWGGNSLSSFGSNTNKKEGGLHLWKH